MGSSVTSICVQSFINISTLSYVVSATVHAHTTWTILLFPQNHTSSYYLDHSPISTKPCKCLLHGQFSCFHRNHTSAYYMDYSCFHGNHASGPFSHFHKKHASAYHTEHFPVSTETMHAPITEHPVSTETMHVPITQNILLFPLASSASPFPVSRIAHTHTHRNHACVYHTEHFLACTCTGEQSPPLSVLLLPWQCTHTKNQYNTLIILFAPSLLTTNSLARVPELIPVERNLCVCVRVCMWVLAETDIHLQLPITYHYFWVEMGHMFLWLFLQFCRPWLFGHLAL